MPPTLTTMPPALHSVMMLSSTRGSASLRISTPHPFAPWMVFCDAMPVAPSVNTSPDPAPPPMKLTLTRGLEPPPTRMLVAVWLATVLPSTRHWLWLSRTIPQPRLWDTSFVVICGHGGGGARAARSSATTREGGGGESGTQKFVYPKWHDKIFQGYISFFPAVVTLVGEGGGGLLQWCMAILILPGEGGGGF